MSDLKFVNIHGAEINIAEATARAAMYQKPKERAVDDREKLIGWIVTGFSPDMMKEAERVHNLEREAALRRHRNGEKAVKVPDYWDAEAYMRGRIGRPVRTKPFELEGAAIEAAEIARRAGWVGVVVARKTRGKAKVEK